MRTGSVSVTLSPAVYTQVIGGLAGEDDAGLVGGKFSLLDGRPPRAALQVQELEEDRQRLAGPLHTAPERDTGLGYAERAAFDHSSNLGRIDRVDGVEPYYEPVGNALEQLLVALHKGREHRVGHADHAHEYGQHGGEG